MTLRKSQTGPQISGQKSKGVDFIWIVIFLTPFLLFYTAFTLWPLASTVYYSFFEWDGIKPLENFVGWQNYWSIIQDPVFWLAFRNTIIFALGNTIIKLPLTLLVAVILTRRWLWLKTFFRTLFFSPIIIPVAMAGLVFVLLLNPANGAVNSALLEWGIISRPIDFLGHPRLAMVSLILVSVWQIFGQYMVYWMAALQNVPEELYEAAEIDGANEWQKLIYITLPIIRPVAIIILFLAFVNALRVFGLVVTMTSGGPGQSTYVVSFFIYNQAFQEFPFRYGYASAAAVFFAVVMLAVISIQGYMVSRAQEEQKLYEM
ncbi:MAG: sugar ABC transporter permease [Chloroflexi bacterium]|nr:MAG: sugar ABC transporter permease [Chloroflexota bacterium]